MRDGHIFRTLCPLVPARAKSPNLFRLSSDDEPVSWARRSSVELPSKHRQSGQEFRGRQVNTPTNHFIPVINGPPVQSFPRLRAIVAGLLGSRLPVAKARPSAIGMTDG